MHTEFTTCRLCLVRCGMTVNIEDGKVTRLIGNKNHPLSKGYLCIKGKATLDITNSPKRVIYPQRRVGERGFGQWQRVSWDEALDDIATRLKRIIKEVGANVFTSLSDDVDPVCGSSIARCLLCRIHKIETPPEAVGIQH